VKAPDADDEECRDSVSQPVHFPPAPADQFQQRIGYKAKGNPFRDKASTQAITSVFAFVLFSYGLKSSCSISFISGLRVVARTNINPQTQTS
jgi:hypothetical protein